MTIEEKKYNHIVIATCPYCKEMTKNFTLGDRYIDDLEPDKIVPYVEFLGCLNCKIVWIKDDKG